MRADSFVFPAATLQRGCYRQGGTPAESTSRRQEGMQIVRQPAEYRQGTEHGG